MPTPKRTKRLAKKKPKTRKDLRKEAAIIRKAELNLAILESQERTWKLRAKAKRIRISEVKQQIRTRTDRAKFSRRK